MYINQENNFFSFMNRNYKYKKLFSQKNESNNILGNNFLVTKFQETTLIKKGINNYGKNNQSLNASSGRTHFCER